MSNALVQVGPSEKLSSGMQLLHAILGGTLGHEELDLVRGWAKGIAESVQQLANSEKNSVCVIIDIRDMQTYSDPDVITIITKLMKEDSPYVYRTATFGGTALHEMIEGVIRTMSGRNNLKNFKTEAEAREWVNQYRT